MTARDDKMVIPVGDIVMCDGVITMTRYVTNNAPAILIETPAGETWIASVNIRDTPLEADEIIGDDNNHRDDIDAMIDRGYLTDTGKLAYSGYCQYRILRMCDRMIEELKKE